MMYDILHTYIYVCVVVRAMHIIRRKGEKSIYHAIGYVHNITRNEI